MHKKALNCTTGSVEQDTFQFLNDFKGRNLLSDLISVCINGGTWRNITPHLTSMMLNFSSRHVTKIPTPRLSNSWQCKLIQPPVLQLLDTVLACERVGLQKRLFSFTRWAQAIDTIPPDSPLWSFPFLSLLPKTPHSLSVQLPHKQIHHSPNCPLESPLFPQAT